MPDSVVQPALFNWIGLKWNMRKVKLEHRSNFWHLLSLILNFMQQPWYCCYDAYCCYQCVWWCFTCLYLILQQADNWWLLGMVAFLAQQRKQIYSLWCEKLTLLRWCCFLSHGWLLKEIGRSDGNVSWFVLKWVQLMMTLKRARKNGFECLVNRA